MTAISPEAMKAAREALAVADRVRGGNGYNDYVRCVARAFVAYAQEAVEQEREACAVMFDPTTPCSHGFGCEDENCDMGWHNRSQANDAAAIRARSQQRTEGDAK